MFNILEQDDHVTYSRVKFKISSQPGREWVPAAEVRLLVYVGVNDPALPGGHGKAGSGNFLLVFHCLAFVCSYLST